MSKSSFFARNVFSAVSALEHAVTVEGRSKHSRQSSVKSPRLWANSMTDKNWVDRGLSPTATHRSRAQAAKRFDEGYAAETASKKNRASVAREHGVNERSPPTLQWRES